MKSLLRTPIQTLTAALLVLTPSLVAAQSPSRYASEPFTEPGIGEELRVTYNTNRSSSPVHNYRGVVRGRLKIISEDYLIIESRSGTVVVATSSIWKIERRVGTKPASAPAMALGSAAGFTAGFLIGSLAYRENVSSTSSASNNGLAIGVLLGAPAGALIAWLASRSRPIYEDVSPGSVAPTVAVSPSGRVRLSISLATP